MERHGFFAKVEEVGLLYEKLLVPVINIAGWFMFLIVIYTVFQRYVIGASVRWGVELSRYVMVWMALMASVVCELRDEHIYITYILENTPFWLQRIIKFLSYVFVLYFFYIIFTESLVMVENAARQTSPGLRISMQYPLLIVPIASMLHIIAIIIKIILIFRPRDYVLKIDKQKVRDIVERSS